MSINLWTSSDPFFGGGSGRRLWIAPYGGGYRRRQNYVDPFDLVRWADRQLEQSLNTVDQLFDTDTLLPLRDHIGQLDVNKQGDLNYQIDVSGFRPEELNVDLDGNEIVIKGEHKEQNEGESVHRQFVRRVLIPERVQRDTIKCDLEPNGRLRLTGKSAGAVEGPRPIPIQIGKSQPAASIQQQQQQQQGQGAPAEQQKQK